jgi:hypothetical protein
MRYLGIILVLLLFGCVAPAPPPAADPQQLPEIGGTLSGDLTLDGNYLLASDLHVPAGITLTIKPGTRVYIQPTDSTKIDPEFLSREVEILIRGSLHAVGTSARPITFTPLTDDPSAILWSGLQLVESEQVQLKHVLIEQAEAGVLCLNSSPQISSLRVERSRYGILLQQQSAPQIDNSLLVDWEAGLFCWDQSAPVISNSRIMNQQEEGIYLGQNCRGRFTGNLVKGNDRGVVLPSGVDFAASNLANDNRQEFLHYSKGLK